MSVLGFPMQALVCVGRRHIVDVVRGGSDRSLDVRERTGCPGGRCAGGKSDPGPPRDEGRPDGGVEVRVRKPNFQEGHCVAGPLSKVIILADPSIHQTRCQLMILQ